MSAPKAAKAAKAAEYRCEYCEQLCASFQAVVSHCVASHPDREVSLAHRQKNSRVYTPMRFEIMPSRHLRSGQRIVCSLDRMALGIIGADDVTDDKPQCASLKLYLPLSPEHPGDGSSAGGDRPDGALMAADDDTAAPESDGVAPPTLAATEAMPLALRTTKSCANGGGSKAPQAIFTLTATPDGSHASNAKGAASRFISVKEQLRTKRISAGIATDDDLLASLLAHAPGGLASTTANTSTMASEGISSPLVNVAKTPLSTLTIENSGWHSQLKTNPIRLTQRQLLPSLFADCEESPSPSSQLVVASKPSRNASNFSRVPQNSRSRWISQSPIASSQLTQGMVMPSQASRNQIITTQLTPHVVMPSTINASRRKSKSTILNLSADNYCLVPVDTTTGKIVDYLPKLPLSSLQPPLGSATQLAMASAVHDSSRLKIVDVTSLAPGSGGGGGPSGASGAVDPPVAADISEPPASLQIGGVNFENTDLLSQAVVMRGGERSMSCITYSYDTLAHIVSPGLLISQRQTDALLVGMQTTEVKTEQWPPRRMRGSIMASAPKGTAVQTPTCSNYKIVPLYVSSQSLTPRVGYKRFCGDGQGADCAPDAANNGSEDGQADSDVIIDSPTADDDDDDAAGVAAGDTSAASLGASDETSGNVTVGDAADAVDKSAENESANDGASAGDSAKADDGESTPAVDTKAISDCSNESYSFGCYLCGFISLTETAVARHWMAVHVPEKPYFCCYCCAVFSSSYKTLWHIRKFHADRKLSVSLMPSHVYSNPLLFEVDIGNEDDFEDMPSLSGVTSAAAPREEDEDADQPDGQFVCRKCNFMCRSTSTMKLHIRRQHLQYRPFSCVLCRATFTCSFDLKRHHTAKHTGAVRRLVSTSNLLCKICTFHCTDMLQFHHHMIDKHHYTASIRCSRCSYCVTLTVDERSGKHVKCSGCGQEIDIAKNDRRIFARGADCAYGRKRDDAPSQVFICKICDYKTREKSGMTRHIKYNHTQCRPYKCGYCPYAAVERPKVRIHIASNHRGRPQVVRKCEKAAMDFRNNIGMLFRKLTFTLHDTAEMDLYEGDGASDTKGSNRMQLAEQRRTNTVKELLKAQRASLCRQTDRPARVPAHRRRARRPGSNVGVSCDVCHLTFMSQTSCREHITLVHDVVGGGGSGSGGGGGSGGGRGTGREGEKAPRSLTGEHFRCCVCGYRCHDRSCMARHIKYMHLTGRPHMCPYCEYANVEKTKVRLHVKATHSMRLLRVKTDERLLVALSSEVKKYYIKINESGNKVSESSTSKYRGSVCSLPFMTSSTEPTPGVLVLNMHADEDVRNDVAAAAAVDESSGYMKEEPLEEGEEEEEEWMSVQVKEEPCEEEDPADEVKEELVEDMEVDVEGDSVGDVEVDSVGDVEVDSVGDVVGERFARPASSDSSDDDATDEEQVVDEKLHKMNAVVILEDIVEKILSPSY